VEVTHDERSVVVFDLGGVLIDWNPRYLYRSLFGGDDEQMEWFLANVTTPQWNAEQDRGRSWAEAVSTLVALHPDRADLIRAYHERWTEMLGGAHEDTVALLDRLRSTGVRLFALTNWSAETFGHAVERFPFLAWFEGVVVSGQELLAKPDPRIFRLLLDRYALDPARILYIDDHAPNVEAAAASGMDAIRFTDARRLESDLEERGLLTARTGPSEAARARG
jgi:2-haloacid dehalogenase